VNEINPGWSPVHERAATLAFDQQTASARVVTWQKSPTKRKRPGKSTATSLLLRLLYWIYERRLLDQLKQRPTPRHVGIILDGNRRHAAKSQAREGASLSDAIERITPEAIACHLYASNLPDPDLIIRTSGEIRLSGFLLWQSVHSEFYFTDVLWPAFRKVDFLRAIRAYQARDRRFGR
jgi:undecaprenyl pyrophosphate synthase